MDFYNREKELEVLGLLYKEAQDSSKMVVITGKRRVGKTLLSYKFIKDKPHLYLFVSKKSEPLLCQEYVKQIRDIFGVPVVGEIKEFKDIFLLLLEIGKAKPFVLVIDEFQEFIHINSSVFSDIQNLWDQNKAKSTVLLMFMGSVYSIMHKIFQDSTEPLFGRADRTLCLKPFSSNVISKILKDNKKNDLETLFNYYMLTGGSPKYIDILTTNSKFTFEEIIDFMISEFSPFLNEGKNLLIEELGKEYTVYFSVLELISRGKTSRSEIESVLQKDIGGYLDRMETSYALIKKVKPINAKPGAKLLKYQICDHFLKFWFRFIYRNRTAVETGNYEYIKASVYRNIVSYSGKLLEEFFHGLFALSNNYNIIGQYWEKGHKNEIDLVAINEREKIIVLAEIKRNKLKINQQQLMMKAHRLLSEYPDFQPQFLSLSLEDAKDYL